MKTTMSVYINSLDDPYEHGFDSPTSKVVESLYFIGRMVDLFEPHYSCLEEFEQPEVYMSILKIADAIL